MPNEPILHKYLQRRGITSPWTVFGEQGSGFSGAVVIPSLAESSNLAATLASLAQNPPDNLSRFLVLVVVNHRMDACEADKEDNLATLEMLPALADILPLNLAWVDAASVGMELPERSGGVGLARKIGFDLVLPHLNWQGFDPLLVALDADTLVDPLYLPVLESHFSSSRSGGAVIPFRHQDAPEPVGQQIINLYELFLRSYIHGLEYAGSPYAFHSVGSAMACTGGAYLRSGGMNTRNAGEDFYFLQQLKKTSGIDKVAGTTVYPSSRSSHRVPFGTGRSVSKALSGDAQSITFYHPECFHTLRNWLVLAGGSVERGSDQLLAGAADISSDLSDFLCIEGFPFDWERISRDKKSPAQLGRAFHEWFDGLKTMKLIHYLSAASLPRCTNDESIPVLLQMSGIDPVNGIREQLELLRRLQMPVLPSNPSGEGS